jgi:hypothetical protein
LATAGPAHPDSPSQPHRHPPRLYPHLLQPPALLLLLLLLLLLAL